jgi:hypothetical protein
MENEEVGFWINKLNNDEGMLNVQNSSLVMQNGDKMSIE